MVPVYPQYGALPLFEIAFANKVGHSAVSDPINGCFVACIPAHLLGGKVLRYSCKR
jgi:hypothetical protein